jgi:hypothetical protein
MFWLGYVGLLFAVGFLGLVAEGVAGHILSKDKLSDPLLRRLGRSPLLLVAVVGVGVLFSWLLAK